MIALPPQWRDGRSRHNARATHFSDKLGAALGTILAVIVIVCLLIATYRSKREGGRTQNSPPTGRPSATSGHGRKVKRSSARPRYSTNSPRTRRDTNRKPGRKVHERTGQGQNGPSRPLNNPGPGRLLSVPLEALQDDTTRATRRIDIHQTVQTNQVGMNPNASGQVRVTLSNVAQAPDIAITAPAQLRFSATQTAINLDAIPPEKPSSNKPHFELTETPVTRTNKGKGRKNGNRPTPAIRTGKSSSVRSPPADLPSNNQVIANQPTFNPPTVNQHPLTELQPPTQHPPTDLPSKNPSNVVPATNPTSITPPSTNNFTTHPNPVYPAPTNTLSTGPPPTDPLPSHYPPINQAPTYPAQSDLSSNNPLSLHTVPFSPQSSDPLATNLLSANLASSNPLSTDHPQLNATLQNPLSTTLHPNNLPPPPYPGAHLLRTPPTPQSSIIQTPNLHPVYPSTQIVYPPGSMHPAQTVYTPGNIQPVQPVYPPPETADQEEGEDRFALPTPPLRPSGRVNRLARRGRGKR